MKLASIVVRHFFKSGQLNGLCTLLGSFHHAASSFAKSAGEGCVYLDACVSR